MTIRSSLLPFLVASLPACVGYTSDAADPARIAAEVAARPGGTFTVERALDVALQQNPDLAVLEAEARAAGAATTVPFDLIGEFRGRNEAVGVMVDPIALLGAGPRGAALDAADARLAEAMQQLATARWQTAAAVVECFLVESALRQLRVPEFEVDAEAFAAAGLVSEVARAELAAARAHAAREAAELERARRDNLAATRRLLGLDRATPMQLVPPAEGWLTQPLAEANALLERPDLRLAAARFELADARFREAVAAQYPSFQVGPNVSLRGDPLRAMGMLRIPVGMAGPAAAARAQRDAVRAALTAAFLGAQHEATLAEARFTAASASLDAARGSMTASRRAFAAARVGLEVEPDGFEAFAQRARRLVTDQREHRVAVVESARAAVRRAQAWGWPVAEPRPEESGAVASRPAEAGR